MTPRVRAWLLFSSILISAVVSILIRPMHYVGFLNDDAAYLLLAKSLLHGQYANLSLVGHPPMIHYFPGFPIFLAPWVALLEGHWSLFIWIPWILVLLSVFVFSSLAFRWFPERAAICAILLLAWNTLVLEMSSVVSSESLFVFLILLWVWLLHSDRRKDSFPMGVLTHGLIATFIALSRPEGIFLVGSVAFFLRKTKAPGLRIGIGVALAAWTVWLTRNYWVASQASDYGAILKANLSVVSLLTHVQSVFRSYGLWGFEAVIRMSSTMRLLLAIVVWAVIGWGSLSFYRKAAPATRAYLAFSAIYLAVHLAWPVQDRRFIFPILPAMILLFIEGTRAIGERLRPQVRQMCLLLTTACFVTVGALGVWRLGLLTTAQGSAPMPRHALKAVMTQFPNEVILTPKNFTVALYAGVDTSGLPAFGDREHFLYSVQQMGIKVVWVIFQAISDRAAEEQWIVASRYLEQSPAAQKVFVNGFERSVIYRLRIPPSFVKSYDFYLQAKASIERNDWKSARVLSRKAIDADPTCMSAWNAYGVSWLIEGKDMRAARDAFKAALKLDPTNELIRANLSLASQR